MIVKTSRWFISRLKTVQNTRAGTSVNQESWDGTIQETKDLSRQVSRDCEDQTVSKNTITHSTSVSQGWPNIGAWSDNCHHGYPHQTVPQV